MHRLRLPEALAPDDFLGEINLSQSPDAGLLASFGADAYFFENQEFAILGSIRLFQRTRAETNAMLVGVLGACRDGKNPFDAMPGEYAVVVFDKSHGKVHLIRDGAGIHPLYYSREGERFIFGSKVHQVLSLRSQRRFRPSSVASFLYYEFIFEPFTLFEDIFAADRGAVLSLSRDGGIETRRFRKLLVDIKEAKAPDNIFFGGLRERIAQAYQRRLSDHNGLYLSGGIDSNVGAIVLRRDLGLESLQSVTFGVRDADQSEVQVAEGVARSLGIRHTTVMVDSKAPIDLPAMLDRVNFPYVGMVIISSVGQQLASLGGQELSLFAGQDTRLHTPHINVVDRLLLDKLRYHPALRRSLKTLAEVAARLPLKGKIDKGVMRLRNGAELPRYISHYFFHRHSVPAAYVADMESSLQERIEHALANSQGMRDLFNGIIDISWDSQYTDDISYMRDATALAGNRCEMPYYDLDLSEYSASLPFGLSIRKTKGVSGHGQRPKAVDKFILRRAFEQDLEPRYIFRDKAVCITNHMFLNGCMKPYLDEYFAAPVLEQTSFYTSLGLDRIVERALNRRAAWGLRDYEAVGETQNLLFLEAIARRFKVHA